MSFKSRKKPTGTRHYDVVTMPGGGFGFHHQVPDKPPEEPDYCECGRYPKVEENHNGLWSVSCCGPAEMFGYEVTRDAAVHEWNEKHPKKGLIVHPCECSQQPTIRPPMDGLTWQVFCCKAFSESTHGYGPSKEEAVRMWNEKHPFELEMLSTETGKPIPIRFTALELAQQKTIKDLNEKRAREEGFTNSYMERLHKAEAKVKELNEKLATTRKNYATSLNTANEDAEKDQKTLEHQAKVLRDLRTSNEKLKAIIDSRVSYKAMEEALELAYAQRAKDKHNTDTWSKLALEHQATINKLMKQVSEFMNGT